MKSLQKSLFFKVAISFLTALSLLLTSIPAFAKPLPLSAIPNALFVVTSKDTPPAQIVTPGKAGVDVFHFDLYSRPHEGAKITKMDFQITGTFNGSNFASVKLYDFDSKQLLGTSLFANNHVVFQGDLLFTLLKNKPKKFSLRVDLPDVSDSPEITGGTFSFLIDSIQGYGTSSSNDLALKKVKNWPSNLFTVLSVSNQTSSLTLSASSLNVSPKTVMAGMKAQIFAFDIKNEGPNDVNLKGLTLNYAFQGQDSLEALYLKLLNGPPVNIPPSVPVNGKIQYFYNLLLQKNTTVSFEAFGTIAPVAGQNSFEISVASVDAVDSANLEKITSVKGSASSGTVTVASLVVTKSALFSDTKLVTGADQVILKFNIMNLASTPAVLEKLTVNYGCDCSTLGSASGPFSDFVLYDGMTNLPLSSPTTPVSFMPATIFLNTPLVIDSGKTAALEVRAFVNITSGTVQVWLDNAISSDSATNEKNTFDGWAQTSTTFTVGN